MQRRHLQCAAGRQSAAARTFRPQLGPQHPLLINHPPQLLGQVVASDRRRCDLLLCRPTLAAWAAAGAAWRGSAAGGQGCLLACHAQQHLLLGHLEREGGGSKQPKHSCNAGNSAGLPSETERAGTEPTVSHKSVPRTTQGLRKWRRRPSAAAPNRSQSAGAKLTASPRLTPMLWEDRKQAQQISIWQLQHEGATATPRLTPMLWQDRGLNSHCFKHSVGSNPAPLRRLLRAVGLRAVPPALIHNVALCRTSPGLTKSRRGRSLGR